MRNSANPAELDNVIIGIATEGDAGVAYAMVGGAEDRSRTLRVAFPGGGAAGLEGRDVTYHALSAVTGRLLEGGVRAARFTIGDPRLGADLSERRTVPAALAMPYVTLRCRLNRFRSYAIEAAAPGSAEESRLRDLTARARAEVSLHVAA